MGCGRSKNTSEIEPVDEIQFPESGRMKSDLLHRNGDTGFSPPPPPIKITKILPPPVEISQVTTVDQKHGNYVDICMWCPVKGKDLVVTASSDGKTYLWDMEEDSMEDSKLVDLPKRTIVTCIAWDPQGSMFAVGTENAFVKLFTFQGIGFDEFQVDWLVNEYGIKNMKIRNHFIIICGDDLSIYDYDSKKFKFDDIVMEKNRETVEDVEWLTDETFVAVENSGYMIIHTLPLTTSNSRSKKKSTESLVEIQAHDAPISKVLINPAESGSRSGIFATCSLDTTLKIWDPSIFDPMRAESSRRKHRKGRRKSIVNYKPPIKSKQSNSTDPLIVYDQHFGYIVDIVWINEETIASASYDGTVKIWSLYDADSPLFSLEQHCDHVIKLALIDDQYLISGGHDGTVIFWDFSSGQVVTEFEATGRISHLGISISKKYVFACSYGVIEVLSLTYNYDSSDDEDDSNSSDDQHE